MIWVDPEFRADHEEEEFLSKIAIPLENHLKKFNLTEGNLTEINRTDIDAHTPLKFENKR